MQMIRRALLASVVTVSAVLTVGAQAAESDPSSFYKGKTVELLVGYSAGGGYDTYARTLARHLAEHIPGQPTVVVKNVPGAGSLVLMNQMANKLPNDGTVFGTVNSGMPFEPLFGNPQAQYKVEDMSWVGNLSVATTLGVASKASGVKTWEDLKTKEVSFGATGAGSNTNTIPRVLADLFNLKINIVSGYPGSSNIVLAMERGEVDGLGSRFLSSAKASTPEWFEDGSDVNILYQLGRERSPELPNVPLVREKAATEEQRKAVKLLGARLVMGRPYVAPPGVPQERLAVLRQAVKDTTEDPDFLADAKKQGLSIDFVGGDEMKEFYADVYDTPDEVVAMVKRAME